MKTAMQELLIYILVDCRNENGAIQFNAHETFNKFLEKEKEQIIEARIDGITCAAAFQEMPSKYTTGEQYYNQKYNDTTK